MRNLAGFMVAVCTGVLLFACSAMAPPSERPDAELRARAERLAQETLIIDTHIDVPYRLMTKMEDISARTESGDFDYPRARAGGLNAAFMSVFVPADMQETGGAKEYADKLIDLVESFATRWPDKFALARSPQEIREIVTQGKISLLMGMENGAAVEDDLANLQHFFNRGVRYITLTHGKHNQICDSSYDEERKWNGLSPFGRKVVEEMNRLGIMVDVSHVTDETFYQVMELSKAPPIASHSSCRKFTPGWERNIDDDMIRALAAKGGVVQINFGSAFLLEEARQQSEEYWTYMTERMEANHLQPDDAATKELRSRYWKDRTRIYADISDVVRHIEHVVELVGIDHVGLGSDFEGVGDSLPTGLKDVSDYPNLIYELLRRGYSQEDIEKICGGNLLRVWEEAQRVAAGTREKSEG